VRDLVDVRLQCGDGVDPEPEQVRGVKVEEQAQLEHPLPELRGVREVPGVAVRVPALHHAVLDHQLDAALARVVDQRREDLLGLAQVLGDAARGVAPDEGADRDGAQGGRSVDAGADVRVGRVALGGVGMEVVVVVGEGGELEAVVVERAADAVGLCVVEGVGREVGGGEGAVPDRGPSGQLQRLVSV
jgi:hypothetical protein